MYKRQEIIEEDLKWSGASKNFAKFDDQLYTAEICKSKYNGCSLISSGPGFGYGTAIENITAKSQAENIELFPSLIDFFTDVESIEMHWEIFEIMRKEEDSEYNRAYDHTSQFKNDAWLKAQYYDQDIPWPLVKEYLSGQMYTATLDEVLNISESQEKMSYYVVAE